MNYDAVVIGAGPAGGTAALMLARSGWRVAIVEKAEFPRRKVCGEFMSATNLPLFEELGLAATMKETAGPPILRVGLFARDAELSAPMPTSGSGTGWGRALGREKLDTLLLENAVEAGVEAFQPCKMVHVHRDDGQSSCTLSGKDGQTIISAPVVIAAHGSWERGSLPTHIDRPKKPSDLFGFKGHFRQGRLPADLMPLLVFPGGYGGMVNTDDGRLSLTFCIRRDVMQQARSRISGATAAEAVLQHVRSTCIGVDNALQGAVLDGALLSAGPINPGLRPLYADGLFRVGNIAGEAHPIIAEGISMAMQSGWLLAKQLIAAKAHQNGNLEAVGETYSAEWNRLFAPRIRAASVFAHVGMRPWAVTALLPIVKAVPRILTYGASLSGKTRQITFHDNTLASGHRS